jgi:hypothetical protein
VIALAVAASLASEGCVSFVFARFTPEQSGDGSRACGGYAPVADLGIAFALSGICALGNYHSEEADCSGHPGSCPFRVAPCVPSLIALASMTYGAAADVVCRVRASPAQQRAFGRTGASYGEATAASTTSERAWTP